jgi:hypothetical protein
MNNPLGTILSSTTVLYLLIPSFLFAFGWLRFPYNLISELILAWIGIALLREWRVSFKALSRLGSEGSSLLSGWRSLRWITPVCLILTLWVTASGVGGFGFQNTDYHAANALLKDLILGDWPLTGTVDGTQVPVVYYIGYYLPAAGIGKLFGWNAANLFQFLWTLLGVWLAFGWFVRVSRVHARNDSKRLIVLGVIFALAGGLDYFGAYLLKADIFKLSRHIENWAVYFQYSSHTTLLYWVPQHAIAAWLATGLVLNVVEGEQSLKNVAVGIASAILWSPFGVVGVIPFIFTLPLIFRTAQDRRRLFRSDDIPYVAGAVWIAGIHLLFLGSNQFQFPIAILIGEVQDKIRYLKFTFAFWTLEFAALAVAIGILIIRGVRTPIASGADPQTLESSTLGARIQQRYDLLNGQLVGFIASVVILFVLPFFRIGVNNDLVMRVSIPAVFVFWALVAKVVMELSPEMRLKQYFLSVVVVGVILASFFPAVAEISRSISKYQLGPPEFSEVGTTFEISPRDTNQRIGSKEAFFQKYISR